MKQIVLISLILLSAVSAMPQTQNTDSVINVLETANLTPERKLKMYDSIAQRSKNDTKTFLAYSEKGLALAKKEKHKWMEATFTQNFGIGYTNKGSYDTARIYLEKALALSEEVEDENVKASILESTAILHAYQGQDESALDYFLQALAVYENAGNKVRAMKTLSNIGSIHRGAKNNERAIYYIEKALALADEAGITDAYAGNYYNLGVIYREIEDYDKALEYTLKALEHSRTENRKNFEIACLQNLSSIYFLGLKDYDKAEKYANESLHLTREFGDPRTLYYATLTLSNVYREQKRWAACDEWAQQAWELDSTKIDGGANVCLNIVISNCYLGNIDRATQFFWDYNKIKSQNIDKGNREILTDMEMKYETEKKEMYIASLEKEKKLYIWLGVAGILLAIALGFVLLQKIKNAKKERQLIAFRSVLDGEMGERARLARDLHDRLSGNLSAVKIGLNNNKESLQLIQDKLDGCIEEIRRAAHNLMPVSLQFGLKVALEDFAAQFPNVHFHFFGEERRIEERKEFIIYCCASELVNNSIRHAGAKNINLQLIQSEKHISLTVQDDGIGFDEKGVAKGIGLKNTYDRVTSCNGKIDIITSPGQGTETTIELKIETI